jgi:hypothetical protein
VSASVWRDAYRSEPGTQDSELVRREIQEIKDAFEAFKAAVETGEMTGSVSERMTRPD